jgi:TP901 family phage tail tape measure protein
MERLGKSITSFGTKMTVGVTLPLIALGGAAVKTAIDFEEAFTGVTKTVDGTAAQMSELRGELERLATSGESPVSSLKNAQVALFEIAEAAGQLGVAREDIVEFTDVMGQLAISTNVVGEDGARALARFANVTDFPLENVRAMGDVIVDLGNNLATTESEILTFGRRMGTLSQIGFKPEEILAFGGALASLGINAEAGSNTFVKAAQQIRVHAENGGVALEKIAGAANVTSEEFLQLIQNSPAEAMQKFAAGLGELGIGEQAALLGDLNLTGVRMRSTMLALAGGTDILANSMDLASNAIQGNGALMNEATKFANTTAGQMQLLRNNVAQLANDLGQVILPVFNQFLQILIKAAQWLNNLSDGQKKAIVMFAALIAAIGPIITIFGAVVTLWGTLAGALSTVIGLFGTVSAALPVLAGTIAALASPILLTVAAIGALITAGVLLVKNWDRVKAGAIGIQRALQQSGQGVQQSASVWRKNFSMMGTIAENAATKIIRFLTELNTSGFGAMKEVGTNIIKGLIDGIKSMMKKLISTVIDVAKRATNAVRNAFSIRSPSEVMAKLGEQVVQGFNKGVEGMGGLGVNVPQINGQSTSGSSPLGGASISGGAGGGVFINQLIVPPGTTREQIDIIMTEIGKRANRRGSSGNFR